MKRIIQSVLLSGCALNLLASCSTAFDPEFASAAAGDALEAAGTAYEASVQEAEQQALAYIVSLQALSFEGSLQGVTGNASWSGTLEPTQNLELNYVITFTNYSITVGGVQISGDLAVAVSESNGECSGAWNTNNILIFDPVDLLDFALSTSSGSLILNGSFCDVMSLSGEVDVRGDAIGNDCPVSGATNNPNVDC